MNNLLILDFETTGLDASTDYVIEVGAALYSVDHRCTLQQASTLLACANNPQVSVNSITAEASQAVSTIYSRNSCVSDQILNLVADWGSQASYVVAHNAVFDQSFAEKRLNLFDEPVQWLDSQDMPFPRRTKTHESLVSLALAHGIGVSSAHRALTDVNLLCALFSLASIDLNHMLQVAARPKALFVAQVPFERKDEAKAAGFTWNEPVFKQWSRRMAIEDVQALPFPVKEVA